MQVSFLLLLIDWSGLHHFATTADFARAAPVVLHGPLSRLFGCCFSQEFDLLGDTTGKLLRKTFSHW